MTKNLQVQLASFPESIPRPNDFKLVETPIPDPSANQVLCETIYLSLDPYMRSQIAGRHMSGSVGVNEPMMGETVSRVIKSESKNFKSGDIVRCFGGWQHYSAHDASEVQIVPKTIDPMSYALSILGMPGLTAYAGIVWQGQPKQGDTVVIPAAVGGVGATAGQLAKLRGCVVVGIAGSDEKCQYATADLGYDAYINRNTENVSERLKELCPQGINVFFDLVGGELLQTATERLAIGARVILCGLMSEYNKSTRAAGPAPGLWIKARAIIYGLVVYDFEHRRGEFLENCIPLVTNGALKIREDTTMGLETAPESFCRLMQGANFGKALVGIGT